MTTDNGDNLCCWPENKIKENGIYDQRRKEEEKNKKRILDPIRKFFFPKVKRK